MQKDDAYSDGGDTYLDIQAELGITKHMGGHRASELLYSLCHVSEAESVLEIGCGIGVGPVYLARHFRGQVTATDVSEKMLEWARKRAARERLSHRIRFQQADVQALPFEDESFDVVIVESVLSFVQDKRRALDEIIRVTRTGGYIGVNDSYWLESAPEEGQIDFQLGAEILTRQQWKELWSGLPLEGKDILEQQLTIKQETKDRFKWVGIPYILAAWGRLIKLLWRNPKARASIRSQMNAPVGLYRSMGYGLFVGRKPVK
jgi:ubiquinone/menaquinone biosynthesis C-methylase UbiE